MATEGMKTPELEPGLAVEQVPLSGLHIDPANVRTHGARNLAAIKASLARFGLQKPVVIDANNVVRAGNGTVEAARALGWESIACVRTPLAGSEAAAFAIADNRTAELAAWDEAALAETLRAMQSEDFDLGAVGFTGDELDAMCEGLADRVLNDGRDGPRDDGEVAGDEPGGEPDAKGTGLAALHAVSLEEPRTRVEPGQVFHLGRHVLLCCDVLRDWPSWVPYLVEGTVFLPYPSPFCPLADSEKSFVMVQPDPYLCAVTVDFFEAAAAGAAS